MDDLILPLIHGHGTSERTWLSWPGLADIKQITPFELVQNRRVVIVSPHPDDEILGSGGILATLNNLGHEVLIIAVSDGENSHPGSTIWPVPILRASRIRETENALYELGAQNIKVIRGGFSDGSISSNKEALNDFLTGIISSEDAVICSWRHDGHPDHNAVGLVCSKVAHRTEALLIETPIWAWHWGQPNDPRLPWKDAVKVNLPPYVSLSKRRALARFSSQVMNDFSTSKDAILPPHVLERFFRPFEIFFVRSI